MERKDTGPDKEKEMIDKNLILLYEIIKKRKNKGSLKCMSFF